MKMMMIMMMMMIKKKKMMMMMKNGGEQQQGVARKLSIAIAIAGLLSTLYAILLLFSSINPCEEEGGEGWFSKKNAYNNNDNDNNNNNNVTLLVESTTNLSHIVFGIAASFHSWERRKEYTKLWWKPGLMRGYIWFDKYNIDTTNNSNNNNNSSSSIQHQKGKGLKELEKELREKEEIKEWEKSLPPRRISENTSKFKYTHPDGHPSAIRISRIVSETIRLQQKEEKEKEKEIRKKNRKDIKKIRGENNNSGEIRWVVMGDDDTLFVPENLVRLLSKYDHTQYYYIGSNSESHLQNVLYFSYNMAYGGGGFAISYPLALALEKMQDRCLDRYSYLYGSDDRIHACLAELGVPLTREPGFHQLDVYGNVFGLMASHPLAPLVSLHHLDFIDPLFPGLSRVDSLKHLSRALHVDPAGTLHHSICYDAQNDWSVSVASGYAVQLYRGIVPPRELELPGRSFHNWHPNSDFTGYSFNTRPYPQHPCQRSVRFFMSDLGVVANGSVDRQHVVTNYTREVEEQTGECRWNITSPSLINTITVLTQLDPSMWDSKRAPRRKCCRVASTNLTQGHMEINVGDCKPGEIISPLNGDSF